MKRDENLSRISIVLSRVMDSQNIGSCCRAMKCMGIERLKIVREEPVDVARVNQLAVHASDVYEKAEHYNSLADAIKGASLAVAFTRRRGKFRKLKAFSPAELATYLSQFGEGEVALVFGCEKDGLSDEEVALCNTVCTIETSDKFPSLNLAQAVQIACYSLFTGLSDYNVQTSVVTRSRISDSADKFIPLLDDAFFFKPDSPEKENFRMFATDFITRSALSESELNRVENFFKKVYNHIKFK